ncbi:MAG: regulatory protein RecX [Sterolibacterium sp.]|nr:regulatory protein RecX [Sterolibacterium sp.]MBP9798972.1 regulatory protein RecX [Sterolibacterium sp.]
MPAGKAPSRVTQLRSRAIRLLARRDYSRHELSQKLMTRLMEEAAASAPDHDTDEDAGLQEATSAIPPAQEIAGEIAGVLDQLEQLGLLSDRRAAEAYVRSRAARFGVARLSRDLRARGIDETLIASSLAQEDIGQERQRAQTVWRNKFPAPPADLREWGRQARFLQGRGFSSDIIRSVLKEAKEAARKEKEHHE